MDETGEEAGLGVLEVEEEEFKVGIKLAMMSMGTGKMMVLFFSADMELRVWNERSIIKTFGRPLKFVSDALIQTCKYLNWMAAGDSETISAASRKARLAFCSPSAAITWGHEMGDQVV